LCEFPAQGVGLHEVRERLFPVDLDDRDQLPVARFQLGIAVDFDLLELERRLGADVLEDAASSLAEMAALCVVERDPGYG